MAPRIDIPPILAIAQLVAIQLAMSFEEQKMFGRFLSLTLPRFKGIKHEDSVEFLIACEERLYNLCLVESHGVEYTTF